jgi:hypothetical protein
MSSLALRRPHVNANRNRTPARRERKPLAPVAVTGVFEPGVMPHDLLHGCAILTVTDAARQEVFYWATAITASGRVVALDLQKFGRLPGEDRHRATLDPLACDCEDATYRPDRPGGCRHVNAVRQAMIELASRHGLPVDAQWSDVSTAGRIVPGPLRTFSCQGH